VKPSPVVLDEPEEGSRVRVSAVLGGVLVVVVVGVLAWLATGTPATPDRAPGLRQTVRLRDVWATTPPPPPVAAEAAAAAASAPVAVPPGWLDVCGIGLVKESEWMGQASIEARAASMAVSRRQAVAALKARGDEVSRAAALALEAYGGDVELDEAVACEGDGCPAVPTRVESPQARKRRFASHVATRDQLVQLALGSGNPEVYALAYNVCEMQGGDDAGSSCHMLSADQWARLDPGNGVPWLAVAERAKARGDRAGVAEALYRVGLATSMNARVGSLSQRLIEQGAGQGGRAPGDTPSLETFELASQSFFLYLPGLSGYSVLSNECSATAVRDANRLQQCAAFADTLWSRGTTLFDWNIALALGARVGWSAERQQAARDERDAVMHAAATSLDSEQSLSCESIRRHGQHLTSVGRLGEIGAMRERVRASGRSVADWAREARQVRDAMVRSAEAAPSVPRVR